MRQRGVNFFPSGQKCKYFGGFKVRMFNVVRNQLSARQRNRATFTECCFMSIYTVTEAMTQAYFEALFSTDVAHFGYVIAIRPVNACFNFNLYY